MTVRTVTKIEYLNNEEEVYDLSIGDDHTYLLSNGIMSHNSAVTSMISAYTLHQYLKLQNPAKTFNLLPNTILYGTFVALTFKQVYDSLWKPLHSLISNSPWFVNYSEMLDYHGKKKGEEFYRINETFIRYKISGIDFYPAAADGKTLRGRSRILASVDEIGWFDANNDDKVRDNANSIYDALQNSQATIISAFTKLRKEGFNDIPPPIFANISSPSSKLDKITKLYELSKKSKIMYGIHEPTWRMNPNIPRDDPFVVNKYATNPIAAKRDLAALPPLSSSSFISKIKHIKGIIKDDLINAISIKPTIITSNSGKIMRSAKLRYNWRDTNSGKVLAIDTGYSDNSLALVLAHNEEFNGKKSQVFDSLIEVQPAVGEPINLNDVFNNIIIPIIENFNVRLVVFDRWQNLKMMHEIEANYEHVITEQYSLKYPDFDSFRHDILDCNIRIPKSELKIKNIVSMLDPGLDREYPQCFNLKPISHFIFQILTVQDYPGKSVEKGDNVTDDIFRAAVLAYSYLVDLQYAEILTGGLNKRVINAIGAVATATSSKNPTQGKNSSATVAKANIVNLTPIKGNRIFLKS